MEAILKFKEAASEFQKSTIYQNLDAARTANDEDTVLQDKIGEFNLARLELNNEMSKDDKDEAKIAEMNAQVGRLYEEVMNNENMQAYGRAKDDIEAFMNYVNAVLNAAINGDDPMLVDEPSACCDDGGCASCSGCG